MASETPKKWKFTTTAGLVLAVVCILVGTTVAIILPRFLKHEEPVNQVLSVSDTREKTPVVSREELRNQEKAVERPSRIKIEKIGVDAAIEEVGLTEEGAMDVPKEKDNTGWYKKGPKPGEMGSAVIAGHLDWYNNQRAVFYDLSKVEVGDEVVVEDKEGAAKTFVVYDIQEYNATDDATKVFKKDDGIYLNLITCQGTWDSKKDTYSKRLIVFTKLQEL